MSDLNPALDQPAPAQQPMPQPAHQPGHQIDATLVARDETAATAVAPASSMLQGATASLGGGMLRRKIARRLARKAAGGHDDNGVSAGADGAIAAASASSGSALPADVKRTFEGSLGSDLSGVRVHTGSASAAAADSVSARAYTVGSDIHFNQGQYDPGSRDGQHLLAHEVAHTVQQSGGGASGRQAKLEVSTPGDAHETEADHAADAMVSGAPAHVVGQGTAVSRNIFGDAWNGIKKVGSAIGNAVVGAVDAVGEAIADAGDWIVEMAGIIGIVGTPDGVITKDVPASGGAPALPTGTAVHVKAAKHTGQLKVHAYSGINADAVIPKDAFHAEPGLVHQHDAANKDLGVRDDVYQEYTGPLWGPNGPQAADAYTQGALGDCYFMASMAAVCGSNPDQIKKLFNPQTPSKNYTITLYHKSGPLGLGGLSPVTYSISDWMPTQRGSDHQQVYANTGAMPSAKNAGPTGNANQGALWVSYLEKAWATHKGSYEKAAGGWGKDAMEALTGVPSQTENTTGTDGKGGGLIEKFRQYQTENRAVAVGTIKDPAEVNNGWTTGKFTQSGDTFTAQLSPSLVFQTVQVNDQTSPNTFYGKDDSNNNILQQGGSAQLTQGKVDYQAGTVTLTFAPGKAPVVANLTAAWDNCGADFQKYGLCGTHEYHFVSIKEPDAINLRNPWGFQDPKPVDAAGMAKCFSEIASNQVPASPNPALAPGAGDLAPGGGGGGGPRYA